MQNEVLNDINTYIKNWEVNILDESAMHNTGVGFKYLHKGEDNKPKLEVLSMPLWFQSQMADGQSFEYCNDRLRVLKNQFVVIHQEIIVPAINSQTFMKMRGQDE